jgi:sulfite exporter TauE/SafE/copper chaperone CopZ
MSETETCSLTLQLRGMTCAHCEAAVERVLRAQPGVHDAMANLRTASASLRVDPTFDLDAASAALGQAGYGATLAEGASSAGSAARIIQAAAALVFVAGLVLLLRPFSTLVQSVNVSENMTLGLVFVIGLVASVSSCMAVTGGLVVAASAAYANAIPELTPAQRFMPHLWFNAGRIAAYAGFGALIGLIGASLMLSPLVSAALTILASVLMMAVGLQMIGLLPPLSRWLQLPRGAQQRIHDLASRNSGVAALMLGAATFFLPCGFTLALQLYVLSQGSAAHGALTMLVFALGTLPALVSLAAVSFFGARLRTVTFRLAGAAIVVLGLFNIQYGFVQATNGNATPIPFISQADAQAASSQPAQVVEMVIDGIEYRPNRFTVKVGVPVQWRIDARHAEGCGRILVARAIGLTKFLPVDKTEVITFTPLRAGEIAFNCSMGMMSPNSGFTVVN